MHATDHHRARRAVLVAAAVVAVPAALPSAASATHQCVPSETYLNVEPTNLQQPIDAGHRMPVFGSCGPHRVSATYVDEHGVQSEWSFQRGEVGYARTEPQRRSTTTGSPSATPPQESRPARRAKRSCRKYSRAKTRAQRRAARRCRARNRRR